MSNAVTRYSRFAASVGLLIFSACGGGSEDSGGGSGGFNVSDDGVIQVFVGTSLLSNPNDVPPLSFDKGAVSVGSSAEGQVRVLNVGTGALNIRKVAFGYEAPAEDGGAPALQFVRATASSGDVTVTGGELEGVLLGPDEELTLFVRYTRFDDDIDRVGGLVIVSDTLDERFTTLTIPVQVGGALPVANITPRLVDFQQVAAGETKTREITISNTGAADLEIRQFNFTGHPDFRFLASAASETVAYEPDGETVTFDPPVLVKPQAALKFNVSFSPQGPDPAEGAIIFYTNEATPQQQVDLTGNANRPCILVTPQTVQFGAKLLGQPAVLPVEISSCGNKDLEVTGIELNENPTGNYSLQFAGLPGGVAPSAEAKLTIPVNQKATFNVQYIPNRENPIVDGKPEFDTGNILITSNSFEAEVDVAITGIGSSVVCPTAVGKIAEGEQVIPQTVLHLFSDQSFAPAGSSLVERKWTVQQPPGSASVFVPSDKFPNPTFEANVAGAYKFSLDVWDNNNVKSCVPWESTVLVIPDEAIHVELVWRTPNDSDETDEGAEAGSDVDLHFVHTKYAVGSGYDGDGDGVDDPWFNQPFDCFWFTPQPNWGTLDPTADDDPSLDRDDTDGAGPENLNLNVPQNGAVYGVGVHYWSDHEFGDAYCTVRIYIYSELVAEVKDVRLSNLDMWDVATIDWPSAKVTFVQGAGGAYKITPNYQNPNFSE